MIDEDTPVYPGDPKPVIAQTATIAKDGWNSKKFTFESHFATHVDAPFHMLENGRKLDEFPVDSFTGKGIVFESAHADLDSIEEGDMVFFIGKISEELARQLIRKKVKMVGVDLMGPDEPPFTVHKMLFKENILIVENLVNLEKLIGKRCTFFVLPLKIRNADAAPCRAIAII